MKRIFVTIPVKEHHRTLLQNAAPGCEFIYAGEDGISPEDVADADIIVGKVPIPMLKQCKHLEFLQLNSAGASEFTAEGVLPEGTALACATGAYGLAISEYLLGALLAMMKKLHLYHDNQVRREWKSEGSVRAIYGSKFLIVGAGDIGSEFARRVKALGGYTAGIRRTVSGCPDCFDEMHTMDKLDALLPGADVVSLSLPATPETYRVIDSRRLSLMKKGVYLLNVGRGTAIDTDALCRAMEEGRLAGAALDVTDPEPLPKDHPLWRAPNVYITPHVSGAYYLSETLDRVVAIAAQNISRFLSGEPLLSAVDFSTGYRAKAEQI
jgi:phosphoglycerate dehydrogenase-like enzyme